MLRLLLLISMLTVLASEPSTAALLDRGDFASGQQTALTFDLFNEKLIRAEVLAIAGAQAGLSVLQIPFATKNLNTDEHHVVFVWSQSQNTYLSYNLRPSRTSSLQLASFDPVFVENTSLDVLIGGAQAAGSASNLYFLRDGLQRLFVLHLPKGEKIKLEGAAGDELEVKTPDLIAVRLPQNYIGRTFPATGRMYEPEPSKSQPVILFSASAPNPTQTFRVRYDLPQPSWVPTVTRLLLKVLGMLVPVLLLYWTKSDKINPRRYRFVALAVGFVCIAIYAYLIFLTVSTGGDIAAILEDVGFALTTAFFAWLTYWMTTKSPQPSVPSGHAPQV